jgi:hypothetical protein
MISELVSKIKQDMTSLDKSSESQMIIEQFSRIVEHLREKAQSSSSCFHGLNL